MFLVFGLGVLELDGRPASVAVALLTSRILQLVLAVRMFRYLMPKRLAIQTKLSDAWRVIRSSAPFGAEVGVASVYVNADTLLVTHFLGFAATGVYQAAARFFQGACQLAPVFASLLLPQLARMIAAGQEINSVARRLFAAMVLTAAGGAAAFVLGAGFLENVFLDASLDEAAAVLPWFGVLLILRFAAAALGIVVTALNGQLVRVRASLFSLFVMIGASVPLMALLGVKGMVMASILSNAVLGVWFLVWVSRRGVAIVAWYAMAAFGAALLAAYVWAVGS
jgi:O-antigen/teichoic acid export membrane protein